MIKDSATRIYARVAVYLFLCACFVCINYFTSRSNFIQLIVLYTFAFAAYLHILFYWKDEHITEALYISVLMRAALLFSFPNLSDDVYRFIWDGRLTAAGINPFLQTPEQFMHSPNMHLFDQYPGLYEKLNSKTYYSVYPPLLQGLFYIAHLLSAGSIFFNTLILKIPILAGEIGSLYFLRKILIKLNISPKKILIYAFNPLVIIELTGNIHYEALMICFLSAAVYFLLCNQNYTSALFFACAAAAKLWPLMLLPFLLKRLGFKQTFAYCFTVLIILLLSFIPFYNAEMIRDFSSGINLYFSTFEFNASLYYLLKWITAFGYEQKLTIQKILPLCFTVLVLLYSFIYKRTRLSETFLFVFAAYFLFSTTIHPWYITPLIFFSALTRYRFPLVWSALIYLTYITYRDSSYTQNYLLISIEYIITGCYFICELYRERNASGRVQSLITK